MSGIPYDRFPAQVPRIYTTQTPNKSLESRYISSKHTSLLPTAWEVQVIFFTNKLPLYTIHQFYETFVQICFYFCVLVLSSAGLSIEIFLYFFYRCTDYIYIYIILLDTDMQTILSSNSTIEDVITM